MQSILNGKSIISFLPFPNRVDPPAADRSVVVDNHLPGLRVSLAGHHHHRPGVFEHRSQVATRKLLGVKVFDGSEQGRPLPHPRRILLLVVIPSVAAP